MKNATDFTQLVKKNPGKFSYGSSGVGTALHLAGEMVKEQAGLFMTHIPLPRRGAADQRPGGQQPGVRRLRSPAVCRTSSPQGGVALGTTVPNARRSRPTFRPWPSCRSSRTWTSKAGSPGRSGQPAQPVVAKLKKALERHPAVPDFRKKMAAAGSGVAAPDANLAQFWQGEVAKYTKIVQFAKIEE